MFVAIQETIPNTLDLLNKRTQYINFTLRIVKPEGLNRQANYYY